MIRITSIFLVFILVPFGGQSQTCCSGGVPVSSNLGFQSSDEHTIQLSLSADLNFLKTLKSGSETLDDDDRLRTTQSYIFRGAYTINSRLTVEAFLPLVRQTRRITTSTGSFDKEATFGIGDPVILGIYNLIQKDVTLRVGGGILLPLGSFTKKNNRGLILLEDLQPGSGAFDFVSFTSFEFPLVNRPTSLFYLNNIISITGANDNSRGGLQTYEFGNDIQVIGGFSDQLLIGKQIVSPGASLRYRYASRDRVNGNDLPGTGGDFLFLRISNSIPFPRLKSNFNLNVEWPILSRVNETQLAPSYILNFGWSTTIENNEPNQSIINF